MNIIITGTSRGIGFEIVKLLSTDSSYNIIAISRNNERLQQLRQECLAINASCRVFTIPFDLAEVNVNEILLPEILKFISSVDILVNNAGALVNKSFIELTDAEIQYVYNVNVYSNIRLIKALTPYMGKVRRTHIVNISSMGGVQGSAKFAGLSAYTSSKAALTVLSECLAEEFKNDNISVNCLALGAVQTEMLQEAFPDYTAPVTASQMAQFIVEFALKGHTFFNGKILPVSLSTP